MAWDPVMDRDPDGYDLDPGRVADLLDGSRPRRFGYRQRPEPDGPLDYEPDDAPRGWEP
jgi:hypothetical protein